MSTPTAYPAALGDRGRFVIPQDIRERHGWGPGTPMVAIDTEAGVVLMSADEGLTWLQARTAGRDLVAELLQERRAESQREAS